MTTGQAIIFSQNAKWYSNDRLVVLSTIWQVYFLPLSGNSIQNSGFFRHVASCPWCIIVSVSGLNYKWTAVLNCPVVTVWAVRPKMNQKQWSTTDDISTTTSSRMASIGKVLSYYVVGDGSCVCFFSVFGSIAWVLHSRCVSRFLVFSDGQIIFFSFAKFLVCCCAELCFPSLHLKFECLWQQQM